LGHGDRVAVDHHHFERSRSDDLYRDTPKLFSMPSHDEHPPEIDPCGNHPWGIKRALWVDPRAPRALVAGLPRAHRCQRDARRSPESSRGGKLDHSARQPAVGQDRIEFGPRERQHGGQRCLVDARET
jgi:hypothetical protein